MWPEWKVQALQSLSRLARNLSVQIIAAMVLAVALGIAAPSVAVQMKPLGDALFRLLRMMLAPVVFTTVALGIAGVADLRRLGRIGMRTLIYFEAASTAALLLGLALINLLPVGAGLHAGAAMTVVDAAARLSVPAAAASHPATMLVEIIPANLLDAFVRGDILQVLFASVICGCAIAAVRADGIMAIIEQARRVVFAILGFVMQLAPIGVFGALAAAVGAGGVAALLRLGGLVALFYAGVLLFVLVVLGGITTAARISLPNILRLIREELLLVFAVVTTEVVLPRLLVKLPQAGVPTDVAGFVLPAGASFNQDGTALYMAMALGFVAQATDTPLSMGEQLAFLAVMLLTSKGSTGMAGGSLVKLAATVQSSQVVPLSSLGLLFGIERPIGSALGAANVLGNVVAAFVIAKWEGVLDADRLNAAVRERAPQGRRDRHDADMVSIRASWKPDPRAARSTRSSAHDDRLGRTAHGRPCRTPFGTAGIHSSRDKVLDPVRPYCVRTIWV